MTKFAEWAGQSYLRIAIFALILLAVSGGAIIGISSLSGGPFREVHDVVNDARIACIEHSGVRSMHDAFAYEVPVVCRDGFVATVKGQ